MYGLGKIPAILLLQLPAVRITAAAATQHSRYATYVTDSPKDVAKVLTTPLKLTPSYLVITQLAGLGLPKRAVNLAHGGHLLLSPHLSSGLRSAASHLSTSHLGLTLRHPLLKRATTGASGHGLLLVSPLL
jgi:hypothetical protein